MLDALWERLLVALESRIPATTLETWVRPCRLAAVHGDQLRVAAPSKFARDWLAQRYADALQIAAREVLGGNPRVSFEVDREPQRAEALAEPRAGAAPGPPVSGLSARYTFASFVVGNSNQFAQAACQAVADLPSKAYNPLFLYGGVGLGKTHLLHAVGHQVSRAYPQMHVLYLSSERFTNELINAIRYDRTAEFRGKYRNIDLLLIDDVQFISGKERTQEEFFHTFNDLYEARKQIVLSSDAAPKEIPEIEERLRSRFEWGLIADIQPPDFETRVAILKKKAEVERVRLPDDVAYLIASRIKANIREIEGSLTRMIAFCALSGREMSIDLAQEVLADLWGEDERVISVDHIQRKVADFFGIKLSDLRAQNRTRSIAFPRQIAMYLARQLTHASLAEIGRSFGGKDHTTVLHAVEKIQLLLQDDPKFRKTIDTLTQGISL
ncbi:MAG: chromosomal replication initiation protein DnaA [Candidatus Rokubacteria bacterium RIFCSPLOWO2_12_FULL_71_19]|nr:MAG: chromosomal replication initiation protein DnaA [Candidatus Rokubacteria bacterium RIFCSPLOWO2_12_FULL_71_19]